MKKININIKTKPINYNIFFTEEILEQLNPKIKDHKVLVITDHNVNQLYTKEFFESLNSGQNTSYKFVVKPGEESKSLVKLADIFDLLLEKGFNRDDYIISLGGGVIGDLAGLAASTYKRGLNLIQIPTTLLSQFDSSIGGKTAVNFRAIKNVIGSFYNPQLVLINSNYLKTISKREFLNGFSEIIKTSFLGEKEIYQLISKNNYNLIRKDEKLLRKIIEKAILFKKDIVKEDLYDKSRRKILNFGHTIGHVLEVNQRLNYKHGEAVALGMKFASLFSVYKNLLNRREYDKIINEIDKYDLPTKIDKNILFTEINSVINQDKKTENNNIQMVLLDGLFNPLVKNVSLNELKVVWSDFIEEGSSN
jgi:3-dehydroquinate synthase